MRKGARYSRWHSRRYLYARHLKKNSVRRVMRRIRKRRDWK